MNERGATQAFVMAARLSRNRAAIAVRLRLRLDGQKPTSLSCEAHSATCPNCGGPSVGGFGAVKRMWRPRTDKMGRRLIPP
jgi:hypothetical protein